jgi:AHBA synthesis associated protein
MRALGSVTLFDLDGVLIDSEALMRYAFEQSYRRVVGAGRPPVEEYLSYCGDSFLRIMDRLNLPRALYPHFREISIRHVEMIRVVAGIPELLAEVARPGARTAIVTGKDAERTAQILDRLELAPYFEVVVCSDMVARPKPNPESVYRALDALEAEPEQAVLVGDTVADIVAARRAGIATVGVTWGIGTREQLAGVGADVVVDRPAELVPLLAGVEAESDVLAR